MNEEIENSLRFRKQELEKKRIENKKKILTNQVNVF